MNLLRIIILLTIFSATWQSALGVDWRMGQRLSLVGDGQSTYYNRSYVVPTFDYGLDQAGKWELNGELLAFYDHNLSDGEGEVKELYLEWASGIMAVGAGAKTYSFSETFGVNIMDILSPRNYESYLLDDSFWSFRSVWGVGINIFLENSSANLIIIPKAQKAKLPAYGSPYDLRSKVGVESLISPEYEWVGDGEAALRFGHLFDFGLDTTLLLATHQSRQLAFTLTPLMEVKWESERVTSMGGTFSYSQGDWVYRGDLLYTHDDLVTNVLFSTKQSRHLQSIMGVDYSGVTSLFLGVQHHFDSVFNYHWISLLARYLIWDDRLELEGMIFSGVNNDDLWVRPRISWLADNYQVRLQYDLLDATDGEGALEYFKAGDRLLLTAEYFY